jgi:hypothetical protein
MQTEKGQPAFENIDDILAERIIDHTKKSADTNAQEQSNIVNENSSSKRIFPRLSKASVLILLAISIIAFLLIKTRSNRR